MTHDRYGRTTQCTNSSTGAPHSDGVFNNETRIKIRHYRQIYTDRTDPIDFLSVSVSTSGHVYDDFVRLFFLDEHRETLVFWPVNYLRKQFRFFRTVRLVNLQGSVGLILSKDSVVRVTMCIVST